MRCDCCRLIQKPNAEPEVNPLLAVNFNYRSANCVLWDGDDPGKESGMSRIFGILGLVLTLATIIVAPAQDTYAAVAAVTAPMMQMDDGAPCPQQSCAKMPDCPMAFPCLSVSEAVATPAARPVFHPAVQIVRFAFLPQPALASLDGSGLRRPPKI